MQQLEARLRVQLRPTRASPMSPRWRGVLPAGIHLLAEMQMPRPGCRRWQHQGRLRWMWRAAGRMILIPHCRSSTRATRRFDRHGWWASDCRYDRENVDCVVRGGELRDLSLMAGGWLDLQLGVFVRLALSQNCGDQNTAGDGALRHHTVGFMGAHGEALRTVGSGAMSIARSRRSTRLAVDDGNAYSCAGLAWAGIIWLQPTCLHPRCAVASWWRCSRLDAGLDLPALI